MKTRTLNHNGKRNPPPPTFQGVGGEVIIIIIGGGGCPGDVGIMESNGSGPGTPTSGGVVVMVEYTKYSQIGTRILNFIKP